MGQGSQHAKEADKYSFLDLRVSWGRAVFQKNLPGGEDLSLNEGRGAMASFKKPPMG